MIECATVTGFSSQKYIIEWSQCNEQKTSLSTLEMLQIVNVIF